VTEAPSLFDLMVISSGEWQRASPDAARPPWVAEMPAQQHTQGGACEQSVKSEPQACVPACGPACTRAC
jgi:hypothetical protein